jgi:hypothetical protein
MKNIFSIILVLIISAFMVEKKIDLSENDNLVNSEISIQFDDQIDVNADGIDVNEGKTIKEVQVVKIQSECISSELKRYINECSTRNKGVQYLAKINKLPTYNLSRLLFKKSIEFG